METDQDQQDQRVLSPARRAQRCRIGLVACLVFVTGASVANDWARSGIFPSARKPVEASVVDRPAESRSVPGDLKSGAVTSQNSTIPSGSFEMEVSTRTNFASAY